MAARKSVPPTAAETEEDRKALKKSIHGSNILDASAVTGAVTGAIVGLAGGPAGVIAGGVIGAAAGIMAGKVLDEEGQRHEKRDAELDKEIGVTTDEIGLGDSVLPDPPAERHAAALEKELGDDEETAKRKGTPKKESPSS